jgi:hypothetical protein
MPHLIRHGTSVTTVFDLLGVLENDMTDALAFTLARSACFLRALVADLGHPDPFSHDNAVLSVQTRRPVEGITDLEIQIGNSFFAILEAKRGSALPTESQLKLYAPVLARRAANTSVLVAVTNATPAFAAATLNDLHVPEVTLAHRSWRRLRLLAIRARPDDTHDAKRLLDHFVVYLEGILGMETQYDNRVFVVSLGGGNPEGWSLSWIDIVEKRGRYFYPVGHRWPDPPNYLGFRFRGKLQRIHHVDGYDIVSNFREIFPEAPDEPAWCPHYCFRLGPAIMPSHEVPAGPRVQRNNRVWCMIDTLLTSPSISDALTETERRRDAAQRGEEGAV